MPPVVVSALNIYPVKSCRGISMRQAVVERRGFRYDRRWMVADENGKFLSQREVPRLALVHTSITNDEIVLAAEGVSSLRIPLEIEGTEGSIVDIWKDSVRALSAGRRN